MNIVKHLCIGTGRDIKKLLMLFLFHNSNNHSAFFVCNEAHCLTRKGITSLFYLRRSI